MMNLLNEQQAMLERSMRSVFVGNIPFDLTEEKLKEIFSEVGPVLSFKLVYDRENGKPKGYGFCEYKDIETANSAMRNLNGYEVGGRILKVDNAANDRTRLEMQNSLSEETPENTFEHIDPDKVPEAISKAVASLPPEQMFELMKQMKDCIQNNPTEARTMLMQNPQLAYGLLQSLVVMRIVDPEVALTMLSKPHNSVDMMNPEPRPVEPPLQIRPDFSGPPPQQPPPMPMPMGVNDVDRPLDPRARMMNLPQASIPPMPSGDTDLRTMRVLPMPQQMQQMPMAVPAPVMPPLPNNGPANDQMMRDPRQAMVPPGPRDPRNMDPRASGGMNMGPGGPIGAPPLPRQPPPPMNANKVGPAPPQTRPQGMPPMQNVGGALGGPGVTDHEKTALIMQVLQLTDEQIAMLPAEQRQSILLLKEQIAKSSHPR